MATLDKLLEQAAPQQRSVIDLNNVRDEYSRYVEKFGRLYPGINEIMAGLTQQIFQAFGERLDRLIDAMPVEQKVETLARDLGWKQPRHLSEWRRAKGTLPSFANLARLAVLGDLSPAWLMFGKGPQYLSALDTSPTKGVPSTADNDLDDILGSAMNVLGKENVKHILETAITGTTHGRSGRFEAMGEQALGRSRPKRTRGGKKKGDRKS